MPTNKPRVIRNRRFLAKRSEGYGTLAEHLKFEDCTFDNCGLCFTNHIRQRCTVRNVWITNCECINSVIGCPILEDVVVDGLKINDLLIGWSTRFKRVVLKGRIGPVKINRTPLNIKLTQDTVETFERDQGSFYKDVDWALDISQGIFTTFELKECRPT